MVKGFVNNICCLFHTKIVQLIYTSTFAVLKIFQKFVDYLHCNMPDAKLAGFALHDLLALGEQVLNVRHLKRIE